MNTYLPGKITISRMSSTHDDDAIRLVLMDETSGVHLFEVRMSVEALGYALTGLAQQKCAFELLDVENAGMIREMKTETIDYDGVVNYAQVVAYVRSHDYEVDGWKCSLTPQARIMSKQDYNGRRKLFIPFHRFVKNGVVS